MEKKIEEIIKNISVAVETGGNKEVTSFLDSTIVNIPFSYEEGHKLFLVNREGVGAMIPVYMTEENKVKTEPFSMLDVLHFLTDSSSENSSIKGLLFVHENTVLKELRLT